MHGQCTSWILTTKSLNCNALVWELKMSLDKENAESRNISVWQSNISYPCLKQKSLYYQVALDRKPIVLYAIWNTGDKQNVCRVTPYQTQQFKRTEKTFCLQNPVCIKKNRSLKHSDHNNTTNDTMLRTALKVSQGRCSLQIQNLNSTSQTQIMNHFRVTLISVSTKENNIENSPSDNQAGFTLVANATWVLLPDLAIETAQTTYGLETSENWLSQAVRKYILCDITENSLCFLSETTRSFLCEENVRLQTFAKRSMLTQGASRLFQTKALFQIKIF